MPTSDAITMIGPRPSPSIPASERSPSPSSRGVTPRDGVYRLAPFAPAFLFALITVCIGLDLTDDIGHASPGHVTGMVVGTGLSLTGLLLMLRMLRRSRARSQELELALDRTRADSVRWREQAGQLLQGIGALIDRQFGEWGLSPSEREVGLLLLKGLSLKAIAEARDASEPTVRQQAQSLYRKAGLSGRAELAAFFLEDLLLPPDQGAATPVPIAGRAGVGR